MGTSEGDYTMSIEHKSFDVECKGIEDESGTVELYAAVFGNVDRTGEVIQPGAFKSLDKFVREGWIAVNHNWDGLGVATIDEAGQDTKGLRIKARFHSTPEAQAVRTTIRERIARGRSVKASIGYKVLEDEQVKMDGKSVRSLKSIDVFEASIVNVPANPLAEASHAKSARLISYEEAEAILDKLEVERKMGRTISASNEAAMLGWADMIDQHAKLASRIRDHVASNRPAHPMMPAVTTVPASPKSLTSEFVQLYRESLAIRAKHTC
jgi:HK97 family phage prohead protease